jgi:hypothetical protein
MSISAPEAHHVHLPHREGADHYDDGPADTDVLDTTEADATILALEAERDEARARAADRLRAARPGEVQLARTAIVVNMAGELLHQAHDQEATPESRRLAIQLATSALGRHYTGIATRRNIAQRHS